MRKLSEKVNCLIEPVSRTVPQDRDLPAPISNLARRKKIWTPALLGGVLWRGFTHVNTHREVLRMILKCPPLTEFVFSHPSFAVKYLMRDYLARGFTVAEHASCFLYHYRRVYAALPDHLFRQALLEDFTIHEIFEDVHRFTLTMGLSRPYDEEGELSLNLCVDSEIVFILAFTIVPGSVVQSPAQEVLLVTRLQGVKGAYAQIAAATKAMHDVAPGALLLAALQGFGEAFGINEIVAVSAVRQSSYSEAAAAVFKEAYDDFFTELGMTNHATGFYRASIPLQGKPLTCIKHGHKLRTREKRAFKQQIQSICAGFFKNSALAASHKLL
jgi:hypothetical protein